MNKFLLLGLLVLLFIRCKKSEENPLVTTTETTITFASTQWKFGVGNSGTAPNTNNYTNTLTNPTSGTAGYTLKIGATTIADQSLFSYWYADAPVPVSLKTGGTATLRARIKLENVQGNGVSIALRGDKTSQPGVLFVSSQTSQSIKGTADFTDYSLAMPYTAIVDKFSIFLTILPNSTGTVTFSDVSVVTK